MSQWPKWLRRQYGKLEICGSSPGYDTNFSLKNYYKMILVIENMRNWSSEWSYYKNLLILAQVFVNVDVLADPFKFIRRPQVGNPWYWSFIASHPSTGPCMRHESRRLAPNKDLKFRNIKNIHKNNIRLNLNDSATSPTTLQCGWSTKCTRRRKHAASRILRIKSIYHYNLSSERIKYL